MGSWEFYGSSLGVPMTQTKPSRAVYLGKCAANDTAFSTAPNRTVDGLGRGATPRKPQQQKLLTDGIPMGGRRRAPFTSLGAGPLP